MLNVNINRKRLGVILALCGDLLLILSVIRIRALRIAESDTPFFTLEFIGLGSLVVVLTLFAVWLIQGPLAYRLLNHRTWLIRLIAVIGLVLVMRGVLALFQVVTPSIEKYLTALLVWLLFFSLASLAAFLPSRRNNETEPGGGGTRYGWLPNFDRSKLLRIGLLVAINILAPLLILEVGLRIWFTFAGTENERIIYTYSGEDISRAARTYQGMPFLNYGLSPAYSRFNSLGYRGPEITIPKPEGIFRIVSMGGSTTYNGNVDLSETYPGQLERILVEEYGYSNIEVINAGTPGYTTWETLVSFEFRVLDLEPDVIILFQGVNDIGPRVYPSEYYRGISPAAGVWRTSVPGLSPSVLYRYLAYNLGLMQNPRDLRRQMLPQFPDLDCCAYLSDAVAAERLQINPPIYYERNLRNIVALAKTHDVDVLMSTWVYFPDETEVAGANSMTTPYRQEAIAEHNAVVKTIATHTQVPMYDLAANFPYDPDFWTGDGVHMTAPGLLEQAQQYAAFLVERMLPLSLAS